MQLNLLKGKSRRTRIFTVITALGITVLVVINLLLSYFGVQKTIFIDMTPEGLYTLSDAMKEECDEMFSDIENSGAGKKVKITFCTDPDYLESSAVSSLTYFMTLKLYNKYPDALEKPETVNVRINPTAVAQYKTTSLSKITQNNVIISYGDRYRIVTLDSFWVQGSNNTYHYNGEYRMASLIKSVSAVGQPAAYFVTDHEETVYDFENPESADSLKLAPFINLLAERGMLVKNLKLSDASEIPEDCVLLIINDPKKDFTYDSNSLNSFNYISETEKIDRYLTKNQGAIIVAKDYRRQLKTLETFLYEWGFRFSDSAVVDREASIEDEDNSGTKLIASYSTDADGYGYAIYGEYADLSNAPLTVIENAGSVECSYVEANSSQEAGTGYATRIYSPFLTSSPNAQRYVWDKETGEITTILDGTAKAYDLAAVSVRKEIDPTENVTTYSYILAANSKDFLTSKFISDPSYANYDILSAVTENISRIDEHASMDLGGLSLNSASGGGKKLIPTELSTEDRTIYSNKYVYKDGKRVLAVIKHTRGITTSAVTVFTILSFAAPIALLCVGTVVCVKRRYL